MFSDSLDKAWLYNTEPFLLTLDIFGQDDKNTMQVSRPGVSLVLQLNFSNKHDEMFRTLVKPEDCHEFNSSCHPVMQKYKRRFFRETLAWVRIDLDLSTNEALIEELQTDWIRRVRYLRSFSFYNNPRCGLHEDWRNAYSILIKNNNHNPRFHPVDLFGFNGDSGGLSIYLNNVIENYDCIWDEALLTAALQFIHHELGIDNIYMHSDDSGATVKKMHGSKPPRSIYNDLPKQFCFSKIAQAPEFLCKNSAFRRLNKKLGGTRWNYLNLGEHYAHINSTAAAKSGRPITFAA